MESKEFAVIKTGAKQYKVVVGQILKIEKLSGVYKEGDKVVFDEVFLFDNGKDTSVGTPTVTGKKVEGILSKIGRAAKIEVVKYKPKSRYHKKNGHRQPFFEIKISAIK